MLCDHLVVGIRNNLLKQLQLNAELTLAKKTTRLPKVVHEQQQTLKASTNPSSVAALQPGRGHRQLRSVRAMTVSYSVQQHTDLHSLWEGTTSPRQVPH